MSKSLDRTSKVAHRRIQRQMAQNTERINRLLKKYAKIGQGFTDDLDPTMASRQELIIQNPRKETHPYDWVDHEKERSEALKEEAARQQILKVHCQCNIEQNEIL